MMKTMRTSKVKIGSWPESKRVELLTEVMGDLDMTML